MKTFILLVVCAMALGGYYYDDIDFDFTTEFAEIEDVSSPAESVANLGAAVSNNMRYIGDSLGQ